MKMSSVVKSLVAGFSVVFSATSLAVPPHLPDLVSDGNRWSITFYDDSSPQHAQWATQTLCFYQTGVVGTHQRYAWVSDSYPDWNGHATQEGDQVIMHGDFQWPFGQKDGGHDAMEWEIVTQSRKNMGTGHWSEWVENGRLGITIGFGNAEFRRIGKCRADSLSEALEYSQTIPRKIGPDGKLMTNPMGIQEDKLVNAKEN